MKSSQWGQVPQVLLRGRALRRRLPAELGGAWYPASVDGGLKHFRPRAARIDPALTAFARDFVRSGSVVWDVGANVGLFTFTAAGLAGPTGHVVAVEADVDLAVRLTKAKRWNPQKAPVDVLCAAVGAEDDVLVFNVAQAARATNYLAEGGGSSMTGGVRESRLVATLRLDSLLKRLPPPHVLKIDVEGAEALVLAGAQEVLRHGPTVLMEVYSENSDRVHEFLTGHGYTYLDAVSREAVARPSYDVICLPPQADGL